jgi:hypothetical protein
MELFSLRMILKYDYSQFRKKRQVQIKKDRLLWMCFQILLRYRRYMVKMHYTSDPSVINLKKFKRSLNFKVVVLQDKC